KANERARHGRRQDECRLGEVELQRQSLHRLARQIDAVFEDGQRVAAQPLFSEHVDDAKGVVTHDALVVSNSRASNPDSSSRASVEKPPADTSRTSTSHQAAPADR